LPGNVISEIRKIKVAEKELTNELGRTPTLDELAKVLEISSSQIESTLNYSQSIISLDTNVGDDESTLGDFISDEDCDNLKEESPYLYNYLSLNKTEITDNIPFYDTIEEDCIYKLFQEDVFKVLSTLPPREQEVLRMRFGIERNYPLTLEEVANYYNITRERVRQIEARALRRLRDPKRSAVLRGYSD
jgi:RNA polymerase primary sigma factor